MTNLLEKERKTFLVNMVSGGLSGVISKVVSAPIERVKLVLQTQHVNKSLQSRRYSGAIDCIRRIYAEQGILAFWRGNVANILRYFPNQAMTFSFKDRFKDIFVGKSSNQEGWRFFVGNVAAGGAGGALALAIVYPLDMARMRMATDLTETGSKAYRGTWHCLRQLYTSGGILSIYAGFPIAVGGVIVFRGLFLGGYDIGKSYINNDVGSRLLMAQVVTTVSGTACYPLDTIRRRMMMRFKSHDGNIFYRNARHCFVKILREEGVRGLFQGLSANLVRSFGGTILLVGYDEVQTIINRLVKE